MVGMGHIVESGLHPQGGKSRAGQATQSAGLRFPEFSEEGRPFGLHELMLDGPAGGSATRTDAQLAVDRAYMGVDRKET